MIFLLTILLFLGLDESKLNLGKKVLDLKLESKSREILCLPILPLSLELIIYSYLI
jgi:hypothetical protein